MEQHLKFSMREQERVDSLANLVYNSLTNKSGVKFINCGGGGGQLDQKILDFESYDLFKDKSRVGHFEFVLKKGTYECNLDLSGFDEISYKELMNLLGNEFPEIDSK